jgi:hypothetical protein
MGSAYPAQHLLNGSRYERHGDRFEMHARLILREGLLLTGVGAAIGFVAAMGLSGAFVTLLFGRLPV